jgi:uncharacterized protein YbcV (DUF1398 family)
MDIAVRETMRECSRVSDDGSVAFPEIVRRLMAAGVERYHQDLMRSERTYYLPNGESETVGNEAVAVEPAALFSAAGIEAAVRAAQSGTIKYKEFCARAMAAGCVAYHVSIAGRRVVYYGRSGEAHVEFFPGTRIEDARLISFWVISRGGRGRPARPSWA